MSGKAGAKLGAVIMRDNPKFTAARLGLLLLPLALMLGGCDTSVIDPAGDVARQQRDIILISTGLMLLIIVPVIILIILFAWHYRQGNRQATYDPDFDHSTTLELVIWSAPLLIIIALGALTWSSTHLLDPFRRLDRIAPGQPIDKAVTQPLRVQVVSLDWKWLFIYPDQGIASVNELVLPVNREVRFDITSSNMMNAFYAPTLAGMVYAMPGMRSMMHAVLNRPGDYKGYSANYSGAGFSRMTFALRGVDQAGFDRWVGEAKHSGKALGTPLYMELVKPSERVPVMHFAGIEGDLFDRIVDRCVEPGSTCMSQMMGHGPHGMPPAGEKPEGAIFKGEEMKATGPNRTSPSAPSPAEGADKRKTSFLLPPAPAAAGAARG